MMKKYIVFVLFLFTCTFAFAEGAMDSFEESFEEIAIGDALLNIALEYHTEFDLVLTGLEEENPSVYKNKVPSETYVTIIFLYTMKYLCNDGVVGEPFKSKYGNFIEFMNRSDMDEALMREVLIYIYDSKNVNIRSYV
jgi:hypothetical protein